MTSTDTTPPAARPIRRLLIANRSEIACRIIQTARELGIETVAVYSEPDRDGAHVAAADRSVALEGRTPAESYLDIDKILAAAAETGADAIHPGYGFLAENAGFARRAVEAGLIFVGPSAEAISEMGDKIRAREAAESSGMPVIPAAALTEDRQTNLDAAARLGYPVLVKAAAGGGGRGMRRVNEASELEEAAHGARREATAAFGDGRVYLEKYILDPRHIEIQVFGDGRGRVVDLGERECSVQRRHQKIVEEAPSPVVDAALRERMTRAAREFAASIAYAGAGTVELVLAPDGEFYFLEMNTRLQVEHAVTEAVTSTDLVRWQLEIASGGSLPELTPEPRGQAIECRVYAEDPANGFLPTGGTIARVDHPSGVGIRVDSALSDGSVVALEYDPMLAKVVAWGADRGQATERMIEALRNFRIAGVRTNIAFLLDVMRSVRFAEGAFTTTTIDEHYSAWKPTDTDAAALASAAAAILIRRGVARSAGRAGGGETGSERPPSPWDTLGAWRLGQSAEHGTAARKRS